MTAARLPDERPAPPESPPRRRRLRGADRRRQIISVAQTLFAERPFTDVSTTDIADAAGVSHGLLNYHFGSKQNLFRDVIRETLWIPRAPMRIERGGPDVEVALEGMVDWWLTEVEKNRETWLSLLASHGIAGDPEVEAMLEEYEESARGDIIAYVTARDARESPPALWALVAAWQGLAEATAVEWLKRKRINRAQAKVIVLEGLHRLLKLQRLVEGEAPVDQSMPAAASAQRAR
jgi:AcrR family transcriptional regulator